MEVFFHPLVKQDVIEALRYYHKISSALADDFSDEIGSTIAQVAANPLRFHLMERSFRRANLRRFPYHILYEVHAQHVRVMHIRHNKRHPDYNIIRE